MPRTRARARHALLRGRACVYGGARAGAGAPIAIVRTPALARARACAGEFTNFCPACSVPWRRPFSDFKLVALCER